MLLTAANRGDADLVPPLIEFSGRAEAAVTDRRCSTAGALT